MICQADNCVFIHIPKVAGQSVESVFLERAGLNWDNREGLLLKPNTNPQLGPPRLAHLTAQEYVSRGYLSAGEFSKMFSFSFVRNPWDRLVSEYVYRKYPYSFEDFLFNLFPQPKDDDYASGRDLYRHVIPQVDFICDKEGNILVDFVGKFESLAEDFAYITQKITGQALSLPHKNKSRGGNIKKILGFSHDKKQHYSQFYNEKSRAYVADLYKHDIKVFGYQFDES